MNISATQNMKLAIQAVGEHRFRSLLTVLGIVIGITTVVTVASLLTGLRAGVVTFFQELGPDNIFVYKTSGDPSQEPPKERKRRAHEARVRRTHPPLVRLRGGCRIAALHSARGGRQSHHGARLRLRIREHQRGRTIAQHGRDLAARFFRRPLLLRRGGPAHRARCRHRRQRRRIPSSPAATPSAAP